MRLLAKAAHYMSRLVVVAVAINVLVCTIAYTSLRSNRVLHQKAALASRRSSTVSGIDSRWSTDATVS